MPQMPRREILEQTTKLPPYESPLEDDLEDLELELEREAKDPMSLQTDLSTPNQNHTTSPPPATTIGNFLKC
eukprot:283951-Amphidinium_carterae.1